MVVSFKYLLRIWLIMIVVQVVWLHYQPINMTKLDAIYYACAIWQLFLVGGEGKAGIVFWYLHLHDHYLIYETISPSLSSLVSTVVSDGKGGLSVGSTLSFLQNKLGKNKKPSKNYFGLTSSTSCVQCNGDKRGALWGGHWTGCAMQEDTSQEKSAVDFVDNKWTSSTQVLVTFLQSSVDNNTVFF